MTQKHVVEITFPDPNFTAAAVAVAVAGVIVLHARMASTVRTKQVGVCRVVDVDAVGVVGVVGAVVR